MSDLFHQLVRPIATTDTLGAFLNGLRIVVIDGTCFDVPDSDENARVFGRPGTQATFPKVRFPIEISCRVVGEGTPSACFVENTIDELKIHQLVRKTHVRSQKPRYFTSLISFLALTEPYWVKIWFTI